MVFPKLLQAARRAKIAGSLGGHQAWRRASEQGWLGPLWGLPGCRKPQHGGSLSLHDMSLPDSATRQLPPPRHLPRLITGL